MIGDLVNWFVMPALADGFKHTNTKGVITPYGRDTHHLEGLKLNGTKAEHDYHIKTPKNLIFIKGSNGSPWDIKSYDAKFIYDWITEGSHGWTDPTSYKAFAPPIPMFSRYPGQLPQGGFGSPNSVYGEWLGGKLISDAKKPPSVLETRYELGGPYLINHGGDIGSLPTLVMSYFWDSGAFREELFLTREFGWVTWTLAEKTSVANGVQEYALTDGTFHNMVVIGGAPKLNFPSLKIE